MKRLKIGILGTRGIPNRYGGFEEFAQYLSKGLVARGHDVYVYSPHTHPYQFAEWEGVHIIHCKDPGNLIGAGGQFFYDLHCNNDARRRAFDVLLHLGYTTDSIWCWRWPRSTAHVVNMDGMEWKRSKHAGPVRLFLKWAEWLAARNAAALVADSEPMQRYFIDTYGVPATHLSYGARLFTKPDDAALTRFNITPNGYFLLIARMEPENNIGMILQGYQQSGSRFPLVVIGNETSHEKRIRNQYVHPGIRFIGPVYDRNTLDNLRFFCAAYFHGHSVGGTNPSLLEAMACGCPIAAHDNPFNRAVLGEDSSYFLNAGDIADIIDYRMSEVSNILRRENNREKIRTKYNEEKNIDDYEELLIRVHNGNKHH